MTILAVRSFAEETLDALRAVAPTASHPGAGDPAQLDPGLLRSVRVVVTGATVGLSNAMMAACPNLRLVHFIGAGYEGIDVAEAARRGVEISNGRGANADSVADHALALLLALLRQLPMLDREVKGGTWNQNRTVPQLAGTRVGVIGLGEIGQRIGRRLAGFDVEVAYTARSRKPDLPWTYHAEPLALARAVDHLIVACPATPDTHHLVDAPLLEALGPQGIVVNIGRGAVIDTDALVAALRSGKIAGAGLDVVEGEPGAPEALRKLDSVILTPHIAALSMQAEVAMRDLMVANVRAALEGREPLTPVR